MNSKTINSFIDRMKHSPLSIDEDQILEMLNLVSNESSKPLDKFFFSKTFSFILSISCVFLFFPSLFILAAAAAYYLESDNIFNSEQIEIINLGFFSFFVSLPFVLYFWSFRGKSDKLKFIVSGLSPVSSQDSEACQMALDLCQVMPEAESLRLRLIEEGRPVRIIHLKAMKLMDTHGAVRKMRAQRSAQAQLKADQKRKDECFRLHGLGS